MTVIADVRIPAEQFTLGQLVSGRSGVYLQFERVIPLDERLLPFFWVEDSSREHIEETLGSHPEVEGLEQIARLDDRFLYRAEWGQDIDGVISSLRETRGTILEGEGTDEYWEFRLRFIDRDSLQQFVDACREKDIDVNLRAVFQRSHPKTGDAVSETQLETLLIAYEKGFFDVPREISLEDLSETFGVSEQAVSQRLRRGTANMIAENYVPR